MLVWSLGDEVVSSRLSDNSHCAGLNRASTPSAAKIPKFHPTRPRSSTVSSLPPPLHFQQQHLQQAKLQNKDSQHTANQIYNPTLLRVHTAYNKKSQHALHASHATLPSGAKRRQHHCIARLPSTAPNRKHLVSFQRHIYRLLQT